MDYCLYKLRFTTALHSGKDNSAISLDNGQMAIHADTIFAALCCEASRNGHLEHMVEWFRTGQLVLSDALPYAGDELHLPRPVLFVSNRKSEGDASLKKALKNLEYIPLSGFESYIKNLSGTALEMDYIKGMQHSFGRMNTVTRVAIKGNDHPLPYHIAAWNFHEDCGLYILAGFDVRADQHIFLECLEGLGWSGIGGKQSSGWGKFKVERGSVPYSLLSMLEDDRAGRQMLLGTALPVDEELEDILSNGWFTVVRRGGFVRSNTYAAGQLKKRTIYMLGPGSCLNRRFAGSMHDLSEHGNHPVWRCANSLFAGVNI